MNKMIAFSALAVLCMGGCTKKKEEGSGGSAAASAKEGGTMAKPESGGAVTLNASGSTFQK
ncbi:MAG TPA: hypothetical protein VK607_07420, partial [Kofleriaceae bacterium]|nr:hypothetical protein [Kofleriaceae bacterium]